MRGRLAIPFVLLVGLTVSACATAGSDRLTGVYKTRVESEFESGALNGVWRLRLGKGAYTFNYTGKSSKNVIISGVYVTSGRRITFTDHSTACSARPGSGGCRFLGCRRPATYTFTATNEKLTFTRVKDPNSNCELPLVLLASGFRRVS